MITIDSVSEMRRTADEFRRAGRAVALVPTSGALHAGHAALIARAKETAEVVVVAVFANPLAFGPNENFARYPRTPESDALFCRRLGVDVLFAPSTEEMFPRGYSTFVTEEVVSKPLCGVSRPAHFRGVTTALVKLLALVRPDRIVLGQRDAQQVAVVRKVIADLCLGVEVTVAPIVRETDGLVLTVRNADLTSGQRQEAAAVQVALLRAKEMVGQGVRIPDRIIAEVTHLLGQKRRVRVIYVAIVDPATMEPLREVVPGASLLALAVWIDEVRLIDNIEL
jgi:pantoate--beta-alanine ligase